MLDELQTIADATRLEIPVAQRLPIAIIGAGAIVDVAHLPAYARAGLQVAGIFDLDGARAAEVAARHGIPRVYASLDEVLADTAVSVVDVAVVPEAQPEIVRRLLQAGRHVLAQKPLAPTLTGAQELAAQAARCERRLVVNQQMRYGEGMAAARAMARAGWIGELTAVDFHVDIATDWSQWGWIVNSPDLDLRFHSIHYLDSIRALLGTPDRVFCAAGRRTGQLAAGETRTMTTLLYDDGARVALHVNHENLAGDPQARFRIDGSRGAIRGTIGLLYDYPHGRPDTVEVFSQTLPTDGWLPYPVTTRWIPDAFAGPMAALLRAIATGERAPTDAEDNLGTLALLEALYASIATGAAQSPAT
ncbi:MAG TPA: Gfo/Idh/MocA family oxidoreductase [Solirubrobacteraceae bacterium]|nr:Gfo/Idh/MocA family oxidoreductase [Solirubrobacteraceae bacterium]